MFKGFKHVALLTLIAAMLVNLLPAASASAKDLTTKYRVYQFNRIVMEYADKNKAVAYAKTLAYSHVEEIQSRKWLWDNFPRYRVYQYDNTLPAWQFATLEEAIREAKKWDHASVRDLQTTGWVWNNYPKEANFQVYQGDKLLKKGSFDSLKSAEKEAKKWARSHIIDLRTNKWVWDNLSEQDKQNAAAGGKIYQMYIEGYTQDDWKYASLKEAVGAASQQFNAEILNSESGEIVYRNKKNYQIAINGQFVQEFHHLTEAIAFAETKPNAVISTNGRKIWLNIPYYQVYQGNRVIQRFNMFGSALKYAVKYSNASIRTLDDEMLWDNKRKLMYWSWNGDAKPEAIKAQVSQTMGLDVDAPTWFQLSDGSGTLEDKSDAATVAWLHEQNIEVHPLLHNSFDSQLTSRFLANPSAQKIFIQKLVSRLKQIGADGINVDFESLSGSDRSRFTAFISQLADAAHRQNLEVSIDLPRGSLKWNDKTAFDQASLYSLVDHVIIMAYDEYYSGSSSPGSVSGIPWTKEGIEEFLSYGIPRDKLVLGVPFYSRLWKLDASGKLVGNRSLLLKDIPQLLEGKKYVKQWDDTYQQFKISYTEDGYRYLFWLEDESSLLLRLKLAEQYHLAGIAAWRLGHEPASIWQTLLQEK